VDAIAEALPTTTASRAILAEFLNTRQSSVWFLRIKAVRVARLLTVLLLLLLPAAVQAQFLCTTNDGTITITGYTGPGGAVDIPNSINGLPVISIGNGAFFNRTGLTGITSIGLRRYSWRCGT
jgi:hypothetical protein